MKPITKKEKEEELKQEFYKFMSEKYMEADGNYPTLNVIADWWLSKKQ